MSPSDTTPQGAELREDGWIEWTGGENPVPGARVDVRFRSFDTVREPPYVRHHEGEGLSEVGRWSHLDRPDDIIAYRVVSPAPAAPTGEAESDGPAVIWLQPSCCVEPIDGRQWSEDQWTWEECEGHVQQGPTKYVRAALQPQPSQQGGAESLDRDALIALIMEETTDDVVAEGWLSLGKPNVLIQGCRYIRRNAPPSPEGYAHPEDAAKNFAGFIADRILTALKTGKV